MDLVHTVCTVSSRLILGGDNIQHVTPPLKVLIQMYSATLTDDVADPAESCVGISSTKV